MTARVHVRPAGPLDARAMADLLNDIIAAGGTTALTEPVGAGDLAQWMATPRAIWHVAEDDGGEVVGFQWVEPHPRHGLEVAQIATFAKLGRTGLGIGSALFDATRAACRAEGGYAWIDAEIRADNASGLAYYQSRGFEDYGRINGHRLDNGEIVGKVLKRYDLD